jgi:hypothetical protein
MQQHLETPNAVGRLVDLMTVELELHPQSRAHVVVVVDDEHPTGPSHGLAWWDHSGVTTSVGEREPHLDFGAETGSRTINGDGTAVRFDETLDERQTQT